MKYQMELAGVLVALVCCGGRTLAQEEPTSASVSATTASAALSFKGMNLARAHWYASGELPPSASAEQIRKAAVPTTAPVVLQTPPGGSATLFALFDVPAVTDSGVGELTIGDIDGNDETFFNGEKVGSTSGWGVSDSGIARVYTVERKLVKQGENVLAVKMTTVAGHPSFGITREPITFGFVPSAAESSAYSASQPASPSGTIEESQARAAISAFDPQASQSLLQRKRPSFGRFGKFFHDGLPTVCEVSPTHLINRNAPEFHVELDRVDKLSLATHDNEPGIDGWHKLVRVEAQCSNQPVRYTALQHLLYPGVVVTLEEGTVLELRVRFPRGEGVIQPLSDSETASLFPHAQASVPSAYAFYEPQTEACPAVLLASGAAINATQGENHIALTLSRSKEAKTPAKLFIFYPLGLKRIDLSARPASFSDLAALASPGVEPLETLRHWFRLGLNEPTGVDEYFSVSPDKGKVRIYQLARYTSVLGADVGKPLLWLPPQVSFAREALKYPAELPPTTSTHLLAFSGEVRAVDPQSSASQKAAASAKRSKKKSTAKSATPESDLYVFSYELPIPPLHERGLVQVPIEQDLHNMLNEHLTDLATTSALNGVDAIYKSRAQGFQAFSYLTPGNKKRLQENSALIVPAALRGPSWYQTTEPLSGLSYWWTYFIEGPYDDRYDMDWGNGLSLTGLYTYAKYSGEWERLEKEWDAIERMFSWFTVSDDWEWMRASNGVHGHGTGAGDCESATYAGTLAYAKLANNLARPEEYYYGLYTASRAALLALNRFAYNDFAAKNALKENESLVVGFHEGAGFLVGELNGYAWNATSNISGNGVQPENFDLYQKYAPQALRDYEELFERSYPRWMDGSYHYNRPTLYRDNSGYITLPHIYLRARTGIDTVDALVEHLKQAHTNTYLWWLAPPVIAEVLSSKVDVQVTDWGRCAFLGAEIQRDQDKKGMRVQLRFENKAKTEYENRTSPEVVEIAVARRPSQVQINNGPVPLTDIRYENGKLRLRLRRKGISTVNLAF